MQPKQFERLALGTVQFGLAYGVTNDSGQVTPAEVGMILGRATEVGVSTLDTAALYGQSEVSLGLAGVKDFSVVTKLPDLGDGKADIALWVRDQLRISLGRLRLNRVYGLLLHRPEALTGESGQALWAALEAVRAEGLVERIGYSVYTPEELTALYNTYRADLIQLPYNVLDRRFETTGWLDRLHDSGTVVHSRSAFLQGLLLSGGKLPAKFRRWRPVFHAWNSWCLAKGTSALKAALGHNLAHHAIDRVLVGVAGIDQFDQILASVPEHPVLAPLSLSSEDIDLINPSRWSAL